MFIGHGPGSLKYLQQIGGRLLQSVRSCDWNPDATGAVGLCTLWWTAAISTAWLIFGASRTGHLRYSLKRCPAWRSRNHWWFRKAVPGEA